LLETSLRWASSFPSMGYPTGLQNSSGVLGVGMMDVESAVVD
jgi:hypothetical protein